MSLKTPIDERRSSEASNKIAEVSALLAAREIVGLEVAAPRCQDPVCEKTADNKSVNQEVASSRWGADRKAATVEGAPRVLRRTNGDTVITPMGKMPKIRTTSRSATRPAF